MQTREPGTPSTAVASQRAVIKQVVAALVVRDDDVLCCQRTRHQAMPLKWEFPGGKIESGEQPAEPRCAANLKKNWAS